MSYASSAGPRTSPLWRTIQREILDPLSIDILEGKVREGQTVWQFFHLLSPLVR